MLQGSPNCSSACAGLFPKLQLHTGTPCYLSGMHSWKAQGLVIQWIAKHTRDLQWTFSLTEEAGKIFWNNDPLQKQPLKSHHLPKVLLPPFILHTVYTTSEYLSVKALYASSIALILTGKNCFAVDIAASSVQLRQLHSMVTHEQQQHSKMIAREAVDSGVCI